MLHLLSSGGFYGAERMLLDHCQALGSSHRVLLLDAPGSLVARFRAAGVACESCASVTAALRALQAARAEGTLINAHNFKAQVLGWLAATLWAAPLIFTQHGFTPRSRKQRLYGWVSLLLCRTARVRRVVCVARSVADVHRRAGISERKLATIANGLPAAAPAAAVALTGHARPRRDVPLLRAMACQTNCTDRDVPGTGIGSRGPCDAQGKRARWLAAFVGRLSAEKGPDLFLDTLIPLCERHPAIHAVMLGDGPERPHLLARIEAAGLADRITLPGFQVDLEPWLQCLDALVISSRTEGTPMVLLEAMQAGVPVAAFAVGGIPDVIDSGRSGLLAPALDVAALREQIRALYDAPQEAAELAACARKVQRERFHLPALALQWHHLYAGASLEVRP